MLAYLRLFRIHQWVKNLFIFAAAFFGGVFTTDIALHNLLPGFVCFCLIASGVYVLNDLMDVAADRLHPVKSKRPIASGEVPVKVAYVLVFVLFGLGLTLGWIVNHNLFILLSLYGVINISYSAFLKRISILDILLVSSGFILRVLAGGVLAGVEVSHWLYIMTFLISLFLAIAKRRDDVLLLESTGAEMRKAVKGYSLEFVNAVMSMMSAVIVVSYILYVTSPEIVNRYPGKPLYVSVIFVIAGLLRYLQIALVEKKSGSPTQVLLKDIFVQVCIIGWIVFFGMTIYYK